ncbi:DUF317 domain-containing protein [Streptomyces sp. NPDC085927]|uniref:DUF317 domain-containing protein n=1 Tax=Streptomyces sp. NPDC085927 TaxID=3365738 RepID=UPI0037CCD0E6
MTDFAPTDRVLISPRHLAGGGLDRLGDALGPLIHLYSWTHNHDATTGHVALDSPCHSLFVDFDPANRHGNWWRISHHEPYWEARFSRQTPIEAIAAFAQALPQFLGDTRHAGRIPVTTSTLVQTADLNNWTMAAEGEATVFTSADGHCALTHELNADTRWHIQHSLLDGVDTDWAASFTRATPVRLVSQFFTHLASTASVQRTFGDLPHLVQHSSEAVIAPVRNAAVNPRVQHALAQPGRTHAAKRR